MGAVDGGVCLDPSGRGNGACTANNAGRVTRYSGVTTTTTGTLEHYKFSIVITGSNALVRAHYPRSSGFKTSVRVPVRAGTFGNGCANNAEIFYLGSGNEGTTRTMGSTLKTVSPNGSSSIDCGASLCRVGIPGTLAICIRYRFRSAIANSS